MTPKPGTARFENLCSFFEELMADPKASRRVRLSAAQRLDALIERQQKAEASEARRQERMRREAAKVQELASLAEDTPEAPTPDDAVKLFHEFREFLRNSS